MPAPALSRELPTDRRMSVLGIANLLDWQAQLGVPAYTLLADTGIDPALLQDPHATLSVRQDMAFTRSLLRHNRMPALGLAAVTTALCVNPVWLSTPMCNFMPKYHCWPFLVWCMSGSRALSAFLVELGAPMMVASTMVPVLTWMPRACNSLPTRANRASH